MRNLFRYQMYRPNYMPYLNDSMGRLHMGTTYDDAELVARRKAEKAYQKALLKASPYEQSFGVPIEHPSLGYGMKGGKFKHPMTGEYVMEPKDYLKQAAKYEALAALAPKPKRKLYKQRLQYAGMTKELQDLAMLKLSGMSKKKRTKKLMQYNKYAKQALRLQKGSGMFFNEGTRRWKNDAGDYMKQAKKYKDLAANYKYPEGIPDWAVPKRRKFVLKLKELGTYDNYRATRAEIKTKYASNPYILRYMLKKLKAEYTNNTKPMPLALPEIAVPEIATIAKGMLKKVSKNMGIRAAGKFTTTSVKNLPVMRAAYKMALANGKTMFPNQPIKQHLIELAMKHAIPIQGHKMKKIAHVLMPMLNQLAKQYGIPKTDLLPLYKHKALQQPVTAGFIGTIAKVLTHPVTRTLIKKTAQFLLPKAAKWFSGLAKKHLGVTVAVDKADENPVDPIAIRSSPSSSAVTVPERAIESNGKILAAGSIGPNTADEFSRSGRVATHVYEMSKN